MVEEWNGSVGFWWLVCARARFLQDFEAVWGMMSLSKNSPLFWQI